MNNVTLSEIEVKRLLPTWMRQEDDALSLAESTGDIIHEQANGISAINKWRGVDNMPESLLDELAWELDVSWYLYDAPIDQKREIIRTAYKIKRKLATKWAMEQILSIYFKKSTVMEYFDYGGLHGHFKIVTEDTSTVYNDSYKFLKVVDSIKRYSQHLDAVEVVVPTDTVEVCYFVIPAEVDTEFSWAEIEDPLSVLTTEAQFVAAAGETTKETLMAK